MEQQQLQALVALAKILGQLGLQLHQQEIPVTTQAVVAVQSQEQHHPELVV
jgi:hypothetical protein